MEKTIKRLFSTNGYVNTFTISGIGFVKKVVIKSIEIKSTALFSNNIENYMGLQITILDKDTEIPLFIPQIEIKAIEVLKLEGTKVSYNDITSNTLMEGTWRETTITILDGELKGQIFKGKT